MQNCWRWDTFDSCIVYFDFNTPVKDWFFNIRWQVWYLCIAFFWLFSVLIIVHGMSSIMLRFCFDFISRFTDDLLRNLLACRISWILHGKEYHLCKIEFLRLFVMVSWPEKLDISYTDNLALIGTIF